MTPEYFLPYTCTLLRLVTSHLKSSVHHVIVRLVCSKDLYWNFVSAMWPGALDFLWPLIAMRQYQFRLPPWTLGGDTIEGAEMDSLGSPWSPLGPGGPWSPWVALFPLGPWGPRGPGGPCLHGAPGLPRLPLIPLWQFTLQARRLRASWTSGWLLHSCLISCFYFLGCICGDCLFLQLDNKHNGW